jgi:hypothetical protein
MGNIRKAKRYLLAGAIIGALLSLSISLLMDVVFEDSLQGTWRDAIAKDLNNLFNADVTSTSIIVNIVFVIVLGILAAFGAFMGFIFSFFIYKFFSFLSSR